MRKKTFKNALFGYKKSEVDAYLARQERERCNSVEGIEQRLEVLAKENTNLGVELKIARSGFVDAAELMQAAQSRVRELESQIIVERERMASLAEELKTTIEKSETERLPQEAQQIVNLLLSRANDMGAEEMAQLKKMLEDADLLNKMVADWDAVPGLSFSLPEGFQASLEEEEESTARTLMHKIYRLRQGMEA